MVVQRYKKKCLFNTYFLIFNKKRVPNKFSELFVGADGFEPPTLCL